MYHEVNYIELTATQLMFFLKIFDAQVQLIVLHGAEI